MANSDSHITTPTVLIIYGATGDLMRRKLVPALFHLYTNGFLPPLLQILGFSRQGLSDEQFQQLVKEVCKDCAKWRERRKIDEFSKLFAYEAGTFEDIKGYEAVAKRLGRQDRQWKTCANKLFYLAVPPRFYETIFQNLADSGLTEPCGPDEGWTRVIVEKPFGKDLETAQKLDAMLGKLFREEQIFRIDHYLGKETARNILAFRFSNSFLGSVWDNRSIKSIHIHFPEENTVEGRGGFYDGIGALRDVGQNHMLQLLALFMMKNPGSFDADSIRRERTNVLEALDIPDVRDIVQRTIRGQYEGYTDVNGVARDSKTETYFRIETLVNLPQWQGVPIYLESGKGLSESKSEIIVQFRHQEPCLCPPGKHYTNELRYRVQPDEGVYMTFWVKKPGTKMVIDQKDFSFDYRQAFKRGKFIDAYAKLLLDAIAGDQTLFVSTDEIMASWRFIDPIVRAWQEDVVPLTKYPVGSKRKAVAKSAKHPGQLTKSIGYVGLGKMGSNMVLRLVENGWRVVATDPNEEARKQMEQLGVKTTEHTIDLIKKLKKPRLIWLMVPHEVVDDVLMELVPHLNRGDLVIDGGNSHYKETVRRAKELEKEGIHFIDVGVSGGPGGARSGACLMVGGSKELYRQHIGLFNDLAVAGGYDYMGKAGAGHFVKMVHNGIEYGMMQAIAEGFTVMKAWEGSGTPPPSPREALGRSGDKGELEGVESLEEINGLDLERIANLYNHGSVIESSLVGWLKDAYDKYGLDLDEISGRVARSGEGQWTVEAAKELGVPVPIIEGALKFRVHSEEDPSYTGQIVSALRGMFGGHDVKKQQDQRGQ